MRRSARSSNEIKDRSRSMGAKRSRLDSDGDDMMKECDGPMDRTIHTTKTADNRLAKIQSKAPNLTHKQPQGSCPPCLQGWKRVERQLGESFSKLEIQAKEDVDTKMKTEAPLLNTK